MLPDLGQRKRVNTGASDRGSDLLSGVQKGHVRALAGSGL